MKKEKRYKVTQINLSKISMMSRFRNKKHISKLTDLQSMQMLNLNPWFSRVMQKVQTLNLTKLNLFVKMQLPIIYLTKGSLRKINLPTESTKEPEKLTIKGRNHLCLLLRNNKKVIECLPFSQLSKIWIKVPLKIVSEALKLIRSKARCVKIKVKTYSLTIRKP